MRVRQARAEDEPELVALFEELDQMQRDWRVFTPRPGFYDEVGKKYSAAMHRDREVVLVAEDADGEVVGMAYGEVTVPSRFSDERALELSGVVVRSGYRGKGAGRELVREAARFAAAHGRSLGDPEDLRPERGIHGVLARPRVHPEGRPAHLGDQGSRTADGRGPAGLNPRWSRARIEPE